jgi:tRNA pseudouridine65 synthase
MLLNIIFEDENFVAINKPPGLLVHRTRIAEEKKIFALQLLRDQVGYRVYPLHRLDRPTSGVLIFGKNQESAKIFGSLFENKAIYKEYFAIVRGYTPEAQIIDSPIKNKEKNILQDAVTSFSTIAIIELPIPVGRYETARYSLVKVIPLSGRMHQIRKHFGHIRHYIIGDKIHGDWRHNRMFADRFDCNQLFLHAYSLRFIHPFDKSPIHIKADFPKHFVKIFKQFEWEQFIL